METFPASLIQKYNVPAPRYTSYHRVPFWNAKASKEQQWLGVVNKVFIESNATKGISIYIHLPFCEALCTYCGCTIRITKNHGVEGGYTAAVL